MIAAVPILFATQLTSAPQLTGTFPRFTDVAADVGLDLVNVSGSTQKEYVVEVNGNGAGFFDYDGDGDMDLVVTNGSTLEGLASGSRPMLVLYDNDGGRFRDVSAETGLTATGWGMGVCIADYDNDGHRDIYLTAYGPNVLYRNNGDQTFSNRTAVAGVGDPLWSTTCAFGDYDRDGDVDLYVANYVEFDSETIPGRGETDVCRYMGLDVFCGPRGLRGAPDRLYRNNGDGTFVDATVESAVDLAPHYGLGVAFSDFDNDGWPDIYVANDVMPNFLFHNDRDGTFTEKGLISGTALGHDGREQAGMGVAIGDYDGNGYMDIFVTNFSRDTNTLYQNLGDLVFADATTTSGMGNTSFNYLGWGTEFVDLDNDGWLDVFVANGHVYPEIDQLETGRSYLQRKEVYPNLGNGRFVEIASRIGGDLLVPQSARGATFGDYDNDGDIDVLTINMNAPPNLYRNEGGNEGRWVSLRLEGTRSNRDAIGARVEAEVGGRVRVSEVRSGGSYLSHNDMRVHFGLGSLDSIDRLRISWPSGLVEEFPAVEASRFVTLREGDGSAVAP